MRVIDGPPTSDVWTDPGRDTVTFGAPGAGGSLTVGFDAGLLPATEPRLDFLARLGERDIAGKGDRGVIRHVVRAMELHHRVPGDGIEAGRGDGSRAGWMIAVQDPVVAFAVRKPGCVRCCTSPLFARVLARSHSSTGNVGFSSTSAAISKTLSKFSVSATRHRAVWLDKPDRQVGRRHRLQLLRHLQRVASRSLRASCRRCIARGRSCRRGRSSHRLQG